MYHRQVVFLFIKNKKNTIYYDRSLRKKIWKTNLEIMKCQKDFVKKKKNSVFNFPLLLLKF